MAAGSRPKHRPRSQPDLKGGAFTLVGLDGGASKVAGWEVLFSGAGPAAFWLGTCSSVHAYAAYPAFQSGFQPVDINNQLSQMSAHRIRLTRAEEDQGRVYRAACGDVIRDLYQGCGGKPLLVGLGMPGLKTADRRGVAAMANGPRLPDFARRLEKDLQEEGIPLVGPLSRLGSDADYCGLGEEYAPEGAFRGIRNGYYLGGGSGAADALKLNGRVVPLDEVHGWLCKTWELQNDRSCSLECYASAGGIQSVYARLAGIPLEKLTAEGIYLERILELALEGDSAARETLTRTSHYLGELLAERITTLYAGWQGQLGFVDPQRQALTGDHPHRGTLLERIVIGQRLGNLLLKAQGTELLYRPLLENLGRRLAAAAHLDERARTHYQVKGRFREEIFTLSTLTAAPALGAAVDAFLNHHGTVG